MSEKNHRISKYNYKGTNTLYWLVPLKKSIFLLDFKSKRFIEE